MPEENKELSELLDKLKKMHPSDEAKKETSGQAGVPEEKPPEKADGGAPPKQMSAITEDIYKKIQDLESDIRTKEEKINLDLEKLDALLEALGDRESELAKKEKELTEKDVVLRGQIDEMKNIKDQLQKLVH